MEFKCLSVCCKFPFFLRGNQVRGDSITTGDGPLLGHLLLIKYLLTVTS